MKLNINVDALKGVFWLVIVLGFTALCCVTVIGSNAILGQ